jgi:hypothetical protein
MWLLLNETPFAVASTWTRDERGAEFWLVAARACFEIDPQGRQSPAIEQTEVQRAPVFAGDPLTSGLVRDSDFVLSKNGTDVLLEGGAYAPKSSPTAQCTVHLEVHTIRKTLNVLGDRRLSYGVLGLSIPRPQPFLNIPLTWERTYGGCIRQGDAFTWEPSNPAGTGFSSQPELLNGTLAPNVEYLDSPYRGPKSGRPAALGAIAQHWQPRAKYGGTYDERWRLTRDPLVPEDFDRRYFRNAPDDQQTQSPLLGHEEVKLLGFTPEGFLGFILPRIKLDMITTFRRYGDVRQEPSIHTLWLMPDRRRFEIVYLSALEVPPGREEKLAATTIRIKRRVGTPASVLRTGVWDGP